MSKPEKFAVFPHEERASFRDMIRYVEGKTGFSARLIEKDYYCSIVLRVLGKAKSILVFKGGTLLSKVHAGFYRLSEDLDFTISMSDDGTRGERGQKAKPFKDLFARLPAEIPQLRMERSLKGSNLSMQYNGMVAYDSVLIEKPELISVEISLREKVYEPITLQAATLIEDPFTGAIVVPPFNVTCLSKGEAYAEKVRAALTRKDAAIRDLYDLDHAIAHDHIPLHNDAWLKLVIKKCRVSGNGEIQISEQRKAEFRAQLETRLGPVLREHDFVAFDFEGAWARLLKVADTLKPYFE
ncbi:MAG: nucleotidyl transferase AbiEii/AbiGii toxin family protein [Deltaproteobacteria bacterium]|nr:nucleotidyl transferase AbiEii/AbiGii toxin family protein [Deltaproteobacteria bacterium]